MAEMTAAELLKLARAVGTHPQRWVVGSEGAVAVRLGPERMLVNAGGANLAQLNEAAAVELKLPESLALLDTDEEPDPFLAEQQPGDPWLAPARDALLLAYLLSLEEVGCAVHAQPVEINQILCSPRARQFADRRSLPQEIIACGGASVLVPYMRPGLALARETKRKILLWRDRFKIVPRVILIQNHGLFALGHDVEDTMRVLEMAVKSAQIFVGSAMLGGPAFLTPSQVAEVEPLPHV